MARRAAGAVRFDFDGSLALARRLWSLADELESLAIKRRTAAERASIGFTGTHAEHFAARVGNELGELTAAAAGSRDAAAAWARSWADAINEQNRRSFAAECDRVRAGRDLADRIAGFFTGHDDLPRQPRVLGAPRPPHFHPTGSLVRY
jgi:hypothetical protein